MTTNPTYLNFDLLITRAGDAYRAYVVDAPGGDADVTFEMPFAPDELVRLVHGEGTRRGLRLVEDEADQTPPRELRDLGSQLYDTVFHDDVRDVLIASQTDADSKGQELRIRLRFADDAVDLATLPWEILFDSTQQHFLALDENRPILRYLSLPRPRPALVVQPPLSILAVLASPSDHNPLNVEQEWQAMEAALADLRDDGKIKLERLESPTFDALRERLLGDPVHVLHFVGHGIYHEEKGEGQLLFEESSGRGRRIPAQAVAQLLHNHAPMRLAYLNACEGAIADQGNVFAGVAQTLVQQGVPAAVAMQDEITDDAAIEMARTFYSALATGRPVDAALTHARVALSTRGNDEWAIPVLFSRSPDNRLFDVVEVLPTPTCPYPGMRPFTEAQQDLFFGRDKEIADAVTALSRHPFLTVVGPSGSGKSSLIYAGIIPALRKSTRFGDTNEATAWTIKTMRPSDSRTLDGDAAPMTALAALLDCEADNVATNSFDGMTLLFVDQFEEVFTLADATEAQHFLTTLHTLIDTPNLTILLTVRADFYPDLMAAGELWESIKANRLELTPLGDDELWAAIVQPAAKVGVTVEDALAVALIADASGESGVLPLVQETLVLLWERVEKRTLTHDAYRQMADGGRSGLQVAIDKWATNVYSNELSPEAQPIARRVFLRLIQFGQGRADTRRQQTVDELRASSDNPATFNQTLTTLADSRLITTSGEEGDSQRQVDISHEALIAGWETLRGWIEGQREAETTRRRLEEKASGWVRLGSGEGGLLDEFELYEADEWVSSAENDALGSSDGLSALLEVSRQAIADRKEAEEAARQRELLLERRSRRRLQVILGILALLLGVSLFQYAKLEYLRYQTRKEGPLIVIPTLGIELEQFEVTNQRYRYCVNAGRCVEPPASLSTYHNNDSLNLPITGIDVLDAVHFCSWIDRELPSFSDWLHVATAGNTQEWPWGDQPPTSSRANFSYSVEQESVGKIGAEWRTEGRTEEGVYDLAGNVSEWTATAAVGFDENDEPILAPWDQKPSTLPVRVVVAGYSHESSAVSPHLPYPASPIGSFLGPHTGLRCSKRL